jgi:hypothetical protein
MVRVSMRIPPLGYAAPRGAPGLLRPGPFFLPLLTGVRGRGVLQTSRVGFSEVRSSLSDHGNAQVTATLRKGGDALGSCSRHYACNGQDYQ